MSGSLRFLIETWSYYELNIGPRIVTVIEKYLEPRRPQFGICYWNEWHDTVLWLLGEHLQFKEK